ncbi:HrcA family transcriptional regulator, partial [Chloroflexota bacterium]
DDQEYEEPHLDGLHFILDKPEFAHSNRIGSLMRLVENRGLLKAIAPSGLQRHTVHVVIGKENREEAIQDYSVIISRYGLPDEATGTIGIVGPTRMPYYSAIPTVNYFSSVLTELVSGLYGKEKGADQPDRNR